MSELGMENDLACTALEGRSPSADSLPKRVADLIIGGSALLFLLPLMVLVAIAVKLTSAGPIFFRQTRTGLGGEPFEILKFRSMYVHDQSGELIQAKRGDTRVTPIGGVLRTTSFDELPQLFNVLLGNMSLVGPRPHALSHDDKFRLIAPDYDKRFKVKPGITGLAQIRGERGEMKTDERVCARSAYDNEYVDSWSVGMDLAILARTVTVVLFDKNAY